MASIPKPQSPRNPVKIEPIPAELRAERRWVCWREEEVEANGKRRLTKVPYCAGQSVKASTTDPRTWSDFGTAVQASSRYDGIGFCLKASRFIGFDFDGVLGPGSSKEYAARIVTILGGPYTEITPSGQGLRCFIHGDQLPVGNRKFTRSDPKFGAEVYSGAEGARYLTVTGNRFSGEGIPAPDQPTIGIAWFLCSQILNDQFRNLFVGDLTGYPSQSEADMAFMGMLIRLLNGDEDNALNVFGLSALGQRDKWTSREDYRRRTLERALGLNGSSRPVAPAPAPNTSSKGSIEIVGILGPPLNDWGNAQRVLALASEDVLYCSPKKQFLVWDERRWQFDELDRSRKIVQDVMLEFAREALNAESKALIKYAGESLNSARLSAAMREVQPHVAVAPDGLDMHPYLLNFMNGTLDLRTLELLPHARAHRITKLVHYDYKPQAAAPRFIKFLERLLPPELIAYLQKALGYSITGSTEEKVAFLCLGKTDTGKTTLLNLIRNLFDEYATLILIDALMQKDEDNNSRADLADLRGCRFAMSSEAEEGQRLREAKLKRITQGQGRIKSVRKYENPIEFPETHKLWIDANHRPFVRETDDAIWNRLVPIPFASPLVASEIDRELPRKLREEAEGIIAWVCEGTRRWQQEGLGTLPDQVQSTRTSWRQEMDRLTAFREACCDEGSDLSNQAQPLYQTYRKWAEECGERPMTQTMFGRRMTDAGFKKEKEPTTGRLQYLGIASKDLFHR